MKNKGLVIGFIISLAFNIGVIIAFLVHLLNPDYEYSRYREPDHLFFKNLNLKPSQWEKLRQIKEEVFKKNHKIQAKIHELRVKIFDKIKSENPDFNKIKTLTDKIAKLKAQKEVNIIESFKELKEILSPSQCKYFFEHFRHRFMWRHQGLNTHPRAHPPHGMCPGCGNFVPWHKGKGSF